MSTQPSSAMSSVTTPMLPNPNGLGVIGAGSGGGSGSALTMTLLGSAYQGFSLMSRQQTKARRPPGRTASLMLAMAARVSAKNIMPKRGHDRVVRAAQVVGLRVADDELDGSRGAGLRQPGSGTVDHRRRDVDPDHPSARPDRSGHGGGGRPEATADVEHALPRLRRERVDHGRAERLQHQVVIGLAGDPARTALLAPEPGLLLVRHARSLPAPTGRWGYPAAHPTPSERPGGPTAVPHEFLSDDWLEAVKAIRDKYADQAPPVPYKIKMNQVISGAPFNGGADIHIYMDTSDGTMTLEKGELEEPEVTVSTDWDTARKIFVDQDQAAGMQAFMSGKIKVQGDMTKLMMMNAVPPDEVAKSVAAEIKDMTA